MSSADLSVPAILAVAFCAMVAVFVAAWVLSQWATASGMQRAARAQVETTRRHVIEFLLQMNEDRRPESLVELFELLPEEEVARIEAELADVGLGPAVLAARDIMRERRERATAARTSGPD